MDVSVIMPVFNRRDVLDRTLAAWAAQGAARGADRALSWELIAVDDASTDESPAILARWAQSGALPLRILSQPGNAGPSAARNRALAAAAGDVALFVGDDIVPEPGLLSGHAAWHAAHPAPGDAVVGRIRWAPNQGPEALLAWLERDGAQFRYGRMADGGRIGAGEFYTSNASVKRTLLATAGAAFDERLRLFEDSDFARRLEAAGLRLWHDAALAAWHVHPTTLETSLTRLRAIGEAAAALSTIAPETYARATGGLAEDPRLRARLVRALLSPALGRALWRPLAARAARGKAPPGRFAARIFMLAHGAAFREGLDAARARPRATHGGRGMA